MLTQSSPDLDKKYLSLVKAALELKSSDEVPQAIELLKKAVRLEPNSKLAYIFLGTTYQELKLLAEAEDAFRNALRVDPQSDEALQGLGLLLLTRERLPEALVYLQKQLSQDPANQTTLDVLVPALLNAYRTKEAEEILNEAWEKTLDEKIAVRQARMLISTGQVERAEAFLQQAIRVNETAHLLVELALALVILAKVQDAVPILQRAIEIRPDYDRAYRGLAHCYTQLKSVDLALDAAERSIAIDPRHYRNWQARCDALLLAQRYEDALASAENGIALINPKDEEALPVLAVLYLQKFTALLRLKRVDHALQHMAVARAALPGDQRFYTYPAKVCLESGRYESAIDLLEQAAAANVLKDPKGRSDWVSEIIGYGIDCYEHGQCDETIEIFNRLYAIAPDHAQLNMALGFVLIGEGLLEQARQHLRRALNAAGPDQRAILLNDLGFIELLQENWKAASQLFQDALVEPDQQAFLRAAYWVFGRLVPDYHTHPSRLIGTRAAALANLACLALMGGDRQIAQEYVDQLLAAYPDGSLGWEVLGCLHAAAHERAAAVGAWRRALQVAEDPRLAALLEQWINQVE
ncbi:MAG: tetratricopeptide repeat protein [Chloroflexota bacterium]